MKIICVILAIPLLLSQVGSNSAGLYQSKPVIGQRYLTTVNSPEQGEFQIPLFKSTPFCQKYICRELGEKQGQSPDIHVFEWLQEDFTSAQESKYLSTVSLGSKNGVVRNATVYSFRKNDINLESQEIIAFQNLALSLTGYSLKTQDIKRCTKQLTASLITTKAARCALMSGTLRTFQGFKVKYQMQLTGDKDPSTGYYISGMNIWI